MGHRQHLGCELIGVQVVEGERAGVCEGRRRMRQKGARATRVKRAGERVCERIRREEGELDWQKKKQHQVGLLQRLGVRERSGASYRGRCGRAEVT